MITRFCTKCKKEKGLSEFGKDRKRSDGIACHCKECKRIEGRERYAKNPEPIRRRTKACRSRIRDDLRSYSDVVKQKYGCAFCAEKELCVLEYHHKKERQYVGGRPVTHMALRGRGAMIKEMNKCVVLCANCHKKVHAGLLTITDSMLCSEPLVYKPRIFAQATPVKSCRLYVRANDDWYIKFMRTNGEVARHFVLSSEEDKAKFSVASRRILSPNWDGTLGSLPSSWKKDTIKNIRRCPISYYENAFPGSVII